MISDFRGKRVTIMGLGRFEGGVGVTRWLAERGARVLVTDQEPAEKLTTSLQQIADLDVELRLGGHATRDFQNTELVVVNPAVPPASAFVKTALAAGVPVTTEINLFAERCRARTVGVTGSVGKSTTTAMIAHALDRTLTGRRVWVGGNLGKSLLASLDQIAGEDVVVLELSSFQLERTPSIRWSPNVAVITNIAPNHLDWHGGFAAYTAAKLNIVRYQDPARDSIIIHDSAELRGYFDQLFGDLAGIWRYGLDDAVPVARCQSKPGVDCDDQRIAAPDLHLVAPGMHNRQNAAAAITVAHVLGVDVAAAGRALADFAGLEHRLQRVCVREGVTYFNDSKSTTPESAITAIDAIDAPLLLILGGYDKGSDLTPVARRAAARAKFSACIGKTGPGIRDAIIAAGGAAELFEVFEDAVHACRARAGPGDAVLLSPACASWGMFEDFRRRGELFCRLVTT